MSSFEAPKRVFHCIAGFGLALSLGACGSAASSDPGAGGSAGAAGSGAGAGGGAGTGDGGSAGSFSCESSGLTAAMVKVPAGEFMMGCNATIDAACEEDEKPSRKVTLAAFEIDVTEVTQDQYAACVIAGACDKPQCDWNCDEKSFPASCLEWSQGKAFCAWAGKRLPTEAEWEKAARGLDGRKYPWGNQEPDCGRTNMAGCAGKAEAAGSHPGGSSPFGALDMAGNMVEMVADWYDPAYYATGPAVDPHGPATGQTYSGRGGGFKSAAEWHRASVRDWYDLTDAGSSLGFRCAR